MPVLIDGNNLLYAARDADPERPPSRSTLCLRLGQWARRTGETVAVIFDGPAPSPGLARQIGDPNVRVGFSGAGVSADAVLLHAIGVDSAAKRLLVVSSDQEIVRAARRRRAKTIGSRDFWSGVLREIARPQERPLEPREKRRGLQPTDVQEWLRELDLGDG